MRDQQKTNEKIIEEMKALRRELADARKEADESRESEERYRTMVENINDVVYRLSPRGFIRYINPKVEEIFGYKPEDLIGRHLKKTTPTGQVPKALTALKRVLSGEEIRGLELEQVDKEGNIVVVEINTAPVKKGGKVVEVQGIMRDVTLRRKAEKEYRTILRTAIDGFWVSDGEGRLRDVNDAICEMLGYTREEMLAMSISDVEAAEDPKETVRHIKNITKKGSDSFETRHRRKDGKILNVWVSVNYMEDGRFFVFIRDVTERKKAGEAVLTEKRRFQHILENMVDGVTVLDMEGKITVVNEACLKQHGFTRDEVMGKTPVEVFIDKIDHPKFLEAMKKLASEQGLTEQEFLSRRKDGTNFLSSVNLSLLRNEKDEPVAVVAVHRDVTERRKAEDVLKEYSRKLERVNKELNDFTFIVSHDLKEPLRNIEAFSAFLFDDHRKKLDKEGRDHLDRVIANADRMGDLIDDLLEVSHIDKTRNPFVEIDVEKVIDEVRLELEYMIKQRDANIRIRGVLPRVFADSVRFKKVFSNLISNAVKFSDKPKPEVEIGCREAEDHYEFYVKDNGPGIEARNFDKIFGVFQKLGRKEDHEGTGAGLAIVKKIVEMHGGRVRVESKVRRGSTFYFTIPKKGSPPAKE